jgi:hypothetical protein
VKLLGENQDTLRETLVFAARMDDGQDVQIGIRKQPAFRVLSRGSGDTNDRAQALAARDTVKMLEADSREPGNFFIREKLLTRFYGDHVLITRFRPACGLSGQTGFLKNCAHLTQ